MRCVLVPAGHARLPCAPNLLGMQLDCAGVVLHAPDSAHAAPCCCGCDAQGDLPVDVTKQALAAASQPASRLSRQMRVSVYMKAQVTVPKQGTEVAHPLGGYVLGARLVRTRNIEEVKRMLWQPPSLQQAVRELQEKVRSGEVERTGRWDGAWAIHGLERPGKREGAAQHAQRLQVGLSGEFTCAHCRPWGRGARDTVWLSSMGMMWGGGRDRNLASSGLRAAEW